MYITLYKFSVSIYNIIIIIIIHSFGHSILGGGYILKNTILKTFLLKQ